MKPLYYLFILFLFSIATPLQAQDFEEAVELYEQEKYQEAVVLFENIGDDRSNLYAGKSHLTLGNYTRANSFLNLAVENSSESIRDEARYSLAITNFQLKNYGLSLAYLHELVESNNRTGLRLDARRMYRQILNYLSTNERFRTLKTVTHPKIRYDLVESAKTYTDADTYRILVTELLQTETDANLRNEMAEELQVEGELQQFFRLNPYPTAPDGMVYNIGVILPTFNENDPDFTIPRNLYYGMILAADEFNSRNTDQKIRLHFENSAENADTTAAAFSNLIWRKNIDAVLGPLFSEPAERMAQLAEEYQIPMLAPLANSDELNLDYNYTFQLNPTFEVHGRNMARFAVEELELDTLAIITDKNALGRASALGFRYEAEKLGAYISYYFEDDFAARGYDIAEYTEVFTPARAIIDSLGYTPTQAIYAPFTGQASNTLVNLLLNDLEAMRSDVVILGSEEWSDSRLSAFQRRLFEIYYSQAISQSATGSDSDSDSDSASASDSDAVEFFEVDFETRFGTLPDRFAKAGYDAANYLFRSLETAGNPVYLRRTLRSTEPQEGLSMKIDFRGKRVNQHVYIQPLTAKAEERLEEIASQSDSDSD